MSGEYLLALDQGTTSSRAVLFDRAGRSVAMGQVPLAASFPAPGWVEQDPEDIWSSTRRAAELCLQQAGVGPEAVAAVGIANQRETVVVFDRATGRPVYPAIVWQCRRTADRCRALEDGGYGPLVRERTGLVLDPYFSATKVAWILDHGDAHLRERAARGEIGFATVDGWLMYRLTGGRRFVTDVTNASRTLVFDIRQLQWDEDLLRLMRVPSKMCPEVVASAGVVGETDAAWLGRSIPIAGMAGDQQAALLGQACVVPGMVKNTYGTGNFLLLHTGEEPVWSESGLLTTVAWRIGNAVAYALEGSLFVTGALLQWLRDSLGVIASVEEAEALANSVPDTGGVVVVPAFQGLGAPYWDSRARGLVIGLTRATTRAHIVRAALEAIAFQTRDVVEAMARDWGQRVTALRVDGGGSRNAFLMQWQADVLGVPVERPTVVETTARGAAWLAGIGIGWYEGPEAVAPLWAAEARFDPDREGRAQAEARYRLWQRALERAKGWADA